MEASQRHSKLCQKKYFEEIIPVKGMKEAILMQRVVPENKDI